MACPAATGAAAKFLATQPTLLAKARDQARSDAMAAAILRAAVSLGFPAILQGQGLIEI
jgi:subtilisin